MPTYEPHSPNQLFPETQEITLYFYAFQAWDGTLKPFISDSFLGHSESFGHMGQITLTVPTPPDLIPAAEAMLSGIEQEIAEVKRRAGEELDKLRTKRSELLALGHETGAAGPVQPTSLDEDENDPPF